jgi:hypothetical protein
MFSCTAIARAGVLLVSVGLGISTTSCRSSQYAMIQYQRPASAHQPNIHAESRSTPADTIPVESWVSEHRPATVGSTASESQSEANHRPALHKPKANHVRNPEARESKKAQWLRQISVVNNPSVAEFAPRHEAPVVTTKRRVPGLVKASLAGGIASHGLLLLGAASSTIWILAMLVPLASILLGVAGLAKIARRRDEYRGKGWAMSAIMLATGAIGLAMVAAAALATSEIVWK